ncbi:MAG: hypothetical protein RIS34_494 [Pseudomonadota bacterium]|jgi:hypothetical protein
MTQSVLDNLTLGYQPLWNQLRQLSGIQLFVSSGSASPVDAPHLMSLLQASWPDQAPPLLLSVQTHKLLCDILEHASPESLWIEVRENLLVDPAMAQRVHQAHQRGLKLVWRGDPGERPSSAMAACFARNVIALTPEEALSGLRASLSKHNGTAALSATPLQSPVVCGHIYESVASRALVEHCLDDQGAWGVAGWPAEDVLHAYRHRLIQPDHRTVVKLIEATVADDSMDAIEHTLSEEPILVYRFMRYLNSVALGLPAGIDSLRHGLMVLGYSKLKTWLLEQLPRASSDLNLRPIRMAMVMRARLMEHLLDAGAEDALRRDVYLCGLMSQIDLLLGEPLATAMQHLPLSPRISAAILSESGPYLPYLQVATALESPHLRLVSALCNAHQISIEEVNRALLRTLSTVQANPAKGLLFA